MALNSYLEFCHLHYFNTDPTPNTLSFYTTFMSHFIKPNYVDVYLSEICHQLEPFFPSIHFSCKLTLVTWTLKGCKYLYSSPVTRKQALTLDDLHSVVSHYSTPHSYDNKLFVAILLTGFFALMRLGELTNMDLCKVQGEIDRRSCWGKLDEQ